MSGRRSSEPRGSEALPAGRHGRQGLAERRRRRRRRSILASCIILCTVFVATLYGLQQNAVRISQIQVFGADSLSGGGREPLADIARRALQGDYFGVIPRSSIFFFPASRIRAEILSAYPEVAAISISRDGLTGISLKMSARVPVARWCGLAPTEGAAEYCYVFDASGYIFSVAASSTQALNPFALYAPLEGDGLEPLRATLANADKLPAAFDFARQAGAFGSPVSAILIRGDEVDDRLESGTRIIYVLGGEQSAFSALSSAREQIDLADGSIEYVDLRFAGETYVKRKK